MAGPVTNAPSEANAEPCAEQKKVDLELLYSTVAPACGQAEETARKLLALFPAEVRITMTPLFAIKSFTARNSVDKLTVMGVEPCDGVVDDPPEVGVTISSFEQAAARHATQVAVMPPVMVDKNSFLFMSFGFLI